MSSSLQLVDQDPGVTEVRVEHGLLDEEPALGPVCYQPPREPVSALGPKADDHVLQPGVLQAGHGEGVVGDELGVRLGLELAGDRVAVHHEELGRRLLQRGQPEHRVGYHLTMPAAEPRRPALFRRLDREGGQLVAVGARRDVQGIHNDGHDVRLVDPHLAAFEAAVERLADPPPVASTTSLCLRRPRATSRWAPRISPASAHGRSARPPRPELNVSTAIGPPSALSQPLSYPDEFYTRGPDRHTNRLRRESAVS